ncbi:3-ketoacyl-ACP reductase [Vallitalea longa]|uniref:3-ketoacyl-ACP reductase n=1 Tax=Vallitalea longa TaxID=2936439 RepID=A0A9W5YC75_9FIRM|nr:SDR family oxidoreductase [Vallitalea longa]GKX30434.1 3-ketoacyl-ACP reductase [Vallitalea longa]
MNKKTVLVTGSSRGIGKSIALKYAKEGFNVVINCSSSFNELLETKDIIESYGVSCLPILADVSDKNSVKNMFEEIKVVFGNIDIVINNAGISIIKLFTDTTEDEWDKIINTNLKSLYNVCQESVPYMIKNQHGNIVNITSMWGITGSSCEVAYSASKGAVNAFTKALAKELAPSHIRVNAIACGLIDTHMNSCLSKEDLDTIIEEIPANRIGKPSEVANLCYYLSSKESSYLTGQIITLDGGLI